MSKYRQNLPQLSDRLFLTDGGMETTFIFHQGMDLPHFAAFDLLKTAEGYQAIASYFRTYLDFAVQERVGFILESPTWRANPDWGRRLGYTAERLATANREAIALLQLLRQAYETPDTPIVISGCLGPRGDGYSPTAAMTVAEAEDYHRPQIEAFAEAGADLAAAFTMNYVQEAIGIVRAAQGVGLPIVISFTVETDGYLPNGQSLEGAIAQVDAATDHGPVYYMINCAHPTHFADILTPGAPWVSRIRALRANASTKSHAELDEAETLDDGNPAELGQQYQALRQQYPHITILGGCCGTDFRHIEAICQACLPVAWASLTQNPLAAIGL
ncbi:MAG TPA: homocysteine S-methyltransferase family protein [Leptolyngbyaceae cyanobacterium M65_K2018_010]|nr:homocysteine S-methyltransferase family protein [Leptolyngbyaceae cyanobacterium M65_K2018_010]